MSTQTHTAPSWLFSFVDLAFLLLLAVTQLGSDERANAVDLGGVAVPRINGDVTSALAGDAHARWQLRVHPAGDGFAPFELILSGSDPSERIEATELEARLFGLRQSGVAQPLLAPHADSRSQDLLEAVSLLEATWGKGRTATVVPEYALR
jgi:hypothetical protein